jgi:hypothetical protein
VRREVAMTTATAVGHVEMRIAKVVGLSGAEDEPVHQYVVLEDMSGDRHLHRDRPPGGLQPGGSPR